MGRIDIKYQIEDIIPIILPDITLILDDFTINDGEMIFESFVIISEW